jgi:uncharacterized protein YoxC
MNLEMSPLPMTASDPIFWMGCSLLLVAISLAAIAVVAIPVVQEMAHVSRSAGKLLDTLDRELPRTLEALRATGSDLSSLQKDVNRGVQRAANVVEQVDRSIDQTKRQVGQAQITAKGLVIGFKAAWQTFRQPATVATLNSEPKSGKLNTALGAVPVQPIVDRPVAENNQPEGSEQLK